MAKITAMQEQSHMWELLPDASHLRNPPRALVYGLLFAFSLHLLDVLGRNIMGNLEMPRFNPRGKNVLRPLGRKVEMKALNPLHHKY